MPADNSVTHWIGELKCGNRDAAQHLWEKYFHRLVQLAGHKLRGRPLRAADQEDVALSAVHSVFRGIEAGRYPSLGDRDDLWRLLMVTTAHKALHLVRNEGREKRGGNRTVFTQDDVLEGEEAAIEQILSRADAGVRRRGCRRVPAIAGGFAGRRPAPRCRLQNGWALQ